MSNRIASPQDLDAAREKASKKPKSDWTVMICSGASCIASGALETFEAFKKHTQGAKISAELKATGCSGPCARGPVVIVTPGWTVYEDVTADVVPRIVSEHLVEGKIVLDYLHHNAKDNEPVESMESMDFFQGQQKIVLRNCGRIDPTKIEEYLAADGYQALSKAIATMSQEDIIDEMKESGLRGRGGAGFPTWLKWRFTQRAAGEEKFVLCNADEGDPGAFMDRSVLEGDPHAIIEGMAIAAYAVGASKGFVYVRAEYPLAVERLTTAIGQARESGFLGSGILGSAFDFDLEIRMGSGAFVCGEETALMQSIEGRRGEPRPRPPFPAEKGLWGKPSLLNNVETYANVAAILSNGAGWYSQFGTEESKGTKVFALAGAAENTGLVEVPIGTTLGEVVYDIGGGIKDGKTFKAAQIGGPSGGCVPKEYLSVPLDYHSLAELGAIMGSGGLIIMDDETCMVDVARFFLEFVQEESCGKCVPCRVGTKRMLEILNRICSGEGQEGDIEALVELGNRIKDTALCGLGQTAPNPVLSTIRHFRHEYEEHIHQKHCAAGVCASLVRAPCQSACPAGVDVPGFVSLIGEKRYTEALQLHRERNPFAAVCARVCFHTCEDHCRRAGVDDPVSIRGLKRYMVDQEITIQSPSTQIDPANANRRVAIVGAGPAGLSCGYFLARLGYQPTVFEAENRPGGMLVQTIPAYRLPREVLAREIRMIEQLGVTIETEKRLGRDFTLSSLREEGYDAVMLAVGAPQCQGLGIPGEEAENVVLAGEFLKQYNIRGSVPVGKNVVVVGGGNAAIDAARTALRLGAKTVDVVYRRTQEQMPAYTEEIEEAIREGVRLRTLTQPIEVITDDTGKAVELLCAPMELGEFDRSGRRRPHKSTGPEVIRLPADQVIAAIGQSVDTQSVASDLVLDLTDSGFVAADPVTGQTSVPWLFAAGDVASGPASVVTAIGAGERAAVGIDYLLSGDIHAFWREEQSVRTDYDPDSDPVPYPREQLRLTDVERRRHSFEEVELPWCEAAAVRQAKRCLRCDFGKVIRRDSEEVARRTNPVKEEQHV